MVRSSSLMTLPSRRSALPIQAFERRSEMGDCGFMRTPRGCHCYRDTGCPSSASFASCQDGRRANTLDAADARSELKAQQRHLGGLVRDTANRPQPEIDRRRRVLPLFEVDPITEDL